MYKVFVNQDEIILTSNVPFGDKISIYDLKEISILEIVKLVKKQKRIFLFHKNPKKSAVDPLQPLDFNQFGNLVKTARTVARSIKRKI